MIDRGRQAEKSPIIRVRPLIPRLPLTEPTAPVGDTDIQFIGGGNMAAALIAGLLRAGHPARQIVVIEPVAARRDWLAAQFGVQAFEQARGALQGSIVLAVKPQQVSSVLAALRFAPDSVLVSIAAGIPVAVLAAAVPAHCAVVRTMPNTPALVGAGITALFAPTGTPAPARQRAEAILMAAGRCLWVEDESQIDAVTAISGSGPAYYFLLTEALADAGVALGLSPTTAAALAHATLTGSGQLAASRSESMADLRAQVTSKGGTTEAAITYFEAAGLRSVVLTAAQHAEARSRALGAVLSQDSV